MISVQHPRDTSENNVIFAQNLTIALENQALVDTRACKVVMIKQS